jgi:prepilin-type N-terminal cleavage/methylation domain-containing protein
MRDVSILYFFLSNFMMSKKGLSLIELILAISIASILAIAIAMATMLANQQRAEPFSAARVEDRTSPPALCRDQPSSMASRLPIVLSTTNSHSATPKLIQATAKMLDDFNSRKTIRIL